LRAIECLIALLSHYLLLNAFFDRKPNFFASISG
jgi:hypothetical protein